MVLLSVSDFSYEVIVDRPFIVWCIGIRIGDFLFSNRSIGRISFAAGAESCV